MEVSASSGAFIHTPGTQSEIATVIQVEFLLFRWSGLSYIAFTSRTSFGRGFCLVFFYFPCCTKVLFKFGFTVEHWASNEHKQLRNEQKKEQVLLYFMSRCWWCYCSQCRHGRGLFKVLKSIRLFGKNHRLAFMGRAYHSSLVELIF